MVYDLTSLNIRYGLGRQIYCYSFDIRGLVFISSITYHKVLRKYLVLRRKNKSVKQPISQCILFIFEMY